MGQETPGGAVATDRRDVSSDCPPAPGKGLVGTAGGRRTRFLSFQSREERHSTDFRPGSRVWRVEVDRGR